MARPFRSHLAHTLHHVTARGNHRHPVFIDDYDRRSFLGLVAQALDRHDATALAYCLMGNHYHLLLEAMPTALSKVMRHINGVHTQRFNRRHGVVGHLFQGPFHAESVREEEHLRRACTYTELNPVRAGLVRHPTDWPWSSYRAHAGHEAAPTWLDVSRVHDMLIGHDPVDDLDRRCAIERYVAMVESLRDA